MKYVYKRLGRAEEHDRRYLIAVLQSVDLQWFDDSGGVNDNVASAFNAERGALQV